MFRLVITFTFVFTALHSYSQFPIASFVIGKYSADSLIRKNELYQVFGSSCNALRTPCNDSISKSFGFKVTYFLNTGCFPPDKSETDSVEVFNKLMAAEITKINGPNWEQRFDSLSENCSKNLCPVDRTLVDYSIGCITMFFYDFGSTSLKAEQLCYADYSLLSILKRFPNINIAISAHSSADEQDSAKTISKKRAENLRDYLVSKGIDKGRLAIEYFGYDNLRIVAEPNSRENRRVLFRVTSTK